MINTFVALDIETTGLNPAEDKIIEIGMAKISDGEIVDSYSTLVNPGIKISEQWSLLSIQASRIKSENNSFEIPLPSVSKSIARPNSGQRNTCRPSQTK